MALGLAIWFAVASTQKEPVAVTPEPPQAFECNGDAKICPDGSSVGRTGPQCEFAACPSPDAKEATLTTYLGGSPTALNITVNPRALVSDSRCAEGVQCIWAGTVEVRTAISSKTAHGEHVLTLRETTNLWRIYRHPHRSHTVPKSQ